MTQSIDFEGQTHEFPDDFSQGDIQTALSSVGQEPSLLKQAGTQLGLTGRYAIEGLANPFGIGDVANSTINAFLPRDKQLGMPSKTISDTLTKVGFPQSQGAEQNIVGDMSRALAGTGGTVGAATALKEIVPRIAPFADNAIMQARGALGSSGAASTVKEMGGGPLAQLGAGLVGGYGATRSLQRVPGESLSDQLKSDAKVSYKEADKAGAIFSEDASQSLPSMIEKEWAGTGRTNPGLHGNSLSVLENNVRKDLTTKKNLSLEDLHQYRQLFGEVINNNLHPNGDLKPDAMKANQAIDAIDELIYSSKTQPGLLQTNNPDAISAFQNAQQLYAKSARADDIQRIIDRANLTQNPATAMSTGFKNLLFSKRIRMFSPEQQALIEKAATTSMPVEFMKGLGSRLISNIMAGTGHIGSSVISQGLTAIPRNMATSMQMQRGQNILNNIARPNSLRQPLPSPAKQLGTLQGINQTGRQ